MADIKKITVGGVEYGLADLVARQTTASGMIIKGTASAATDITGLTNYAAGWCYKASAAFTIPDVGTVENGDMIISLEARSAFTASDWCILQNNVDTFEGATGSTAGTRGLVPAPAIGDKEKFLKGDGSWGDVTLAETIEICIIEDTIILSSEESIDTSINTCALGSTAVISSNNTFTVYGAGYGDVINHMLIHA